MAKRFPKELVDKIFQLIKSAPGNGVPIDKKGRKHVIEITVPQVVKKKVAFAEPSGTSVHNKYSALEGDDMEVGELFLRPAMKA